MGGDIRSGTMEQLKNEETQKIFKDYFHNTLDEMLPGEQHKEERERRHDEGPPIFHVGEILETRGGRFRVTRIDRKGIRLKLMKG